MTMITTSAAYEDDLAIAQRLLTDRLSCGIGDDDFLRGQLPKSLCDALNNTWVAGISVTEWAERAAKVIGI
jgi:hypothetical protein